MRVKVVFYYNPAYNPASPCERRRLSWESHSARTCPLVGGQAEAKARVYPAGTSRAQGQSAACHLSASSLVSHAHLFPA